MNVELLHNPIQFSQLPKNTIALDGAVRGTHLDFSTNRWSFDHHAEGQYSISTRSSAMQVLLALRAGLDIKKIENVFVSSIDADSVTATALVMSPALAQDEDIVRYITMYLDTVDCLGPCGALRNLNMSVFYSLKAGFKEPLTTRLLLEKVEKFLSLIKRSELFNFTNEEKNKCILVSIDNNGNVIGMNPGYFSFNDIYARRNIGILYSPEKVTIGIKSNFVTNKNMLEDGLFEEFNQAEIEKGAPINEEGDLIDKWGGKDLVGGSPFGASTLLSVEEVTEIFCNWLKK